MAEVFFVEHIVAPDSFMIAPMAFEQKRYQVSQLSSHAQPVISRFELLPRSIEAHTHKQTVLP